MEPGFSVLGLGVGDIDIFLIQYLHGLHLGCGKHLVFSGFGVLPCVVWPLLPDESLFTWSPGLPGAEPSAPVSCVRALLEDSESLQPQAHLLLEQLSGIEVSHVKGQVQAFLRL